MLFFLIFFRFFETEPDVKSLFPKIVRMNNENQLEWEIDKDMLQKHAVSVMEGLGAAVESLDESDFLNNVLISIGQTHVKRHIKPQMLKVSTWWLLYDNTTGIHCHISGCLHFNLF